MSGVRGSGTSSYDRQAFRIRGRGGNVGDRGRGVAGGQPRSELRRIARPGSRWTRGQSVRRGQGQAHEDLQDSANEREQVQPQNLSPISAQSNLPSVVDLDEIFRRGQFGEYLDFLSALGNDSIDLLKTLCRTLAEQLLTCKRRLAQLEPAPSPTSSPQLSTQVTSFELPMGTPVLDQFLQEIGNIFHQRNGARLQDVLQLEPPLPPAYSSIVSELNTHFRKGQDQALVTRCEEIIPVAEDGIGSAWGAFPDFLARYFRFLRDADPNNLADLYEKLKSLTK
jgi:hypothetical protein